MLLSFRKFNHTVLRRRGISYEFPGAFRNPSYKLAFDQLCSLDPTKKQITPFAAAEKYRERYRINKLKTDLDWFKYNPVAVHYVQGSHSTDSKDPHVYAGGLSTLFYAIRTAANLSAQGRSDRQVLFINDGRYPIFKSSGFQLHAHGTQYAEYNVLYLLKKAFEENMPFGSYWSKQWHEFDYDNLHLRIGRPFFERPFANTFHYARFFLNQLYHDLFAKNGVGPNDLKLVEAIIDSFRFYRQLNQDITGAGLRPIAALNGRVAMSYDKQGLDDYERTWNNMGIPTTRMTYDDLRQRTTLRVDDLKKPLYAFAMTGDLTKNIPPDGHVKPHLMETIIEYAERKYAGVFRTIDAQVTQVHLNKTTKKAVKVDFNELKTGRNGSLSVQPDFTGSFGHNAVFHDKRRLYNEYTATGTSLNFVLTVSMKKMIERKLGGQTTREGVIKFIEDGGLMPSSDLYNLHFTTYDAVFGEGCSKTGEEVVKLFCRATEGANFNAAGNVADKRDFLNVFRKIHEFYDGDIELVSAGSCTRHTWLENMPRRDGIFLNGQCGVGVSYAAFDTTKWL